MQISETVSDFTQLIKKTLVLSTFINFVICCKDGSTFCRSMMTFRYQNIEAR